MNGQTKFSIQVVQKKQKQNVSLINEDIEFQFHNRWPMIINDGHNINNNNHRFDGRPTCCSPMMMMMMMIMIWIPKISLKKKC